MQSQTQQSKPIPVLGISSATPVHTEWRRPLKLLTNTTLLYISHYTTLH